MSWLAGNLQQTAKWDDRYFKVLLQEQEEAGDVAANAESPRWSLLDGRLHGDSASVATGEPPAAAAAASALVARPEMQLTAAKGANRWSLLQHVATTMTR